MTTLGTRPATRRRGGLAGASGAMALGTVASRATGFLRTVALASAVGTGAVGNSYNVANTTPNILYDLLLGGVLSSVAVPVLVQAARDDDDRGQGFANALITVVALGLAAVAAVAVVLAPWIVRIYTAASGAEFDLTVTWTRWFLPQVVFYGLAATVGAILNTRDRYGAPMAVPVINNIIVIVAAVLFIGVPGSHPPVAGHLSQTQVTILGLGTTLGIVLQAVALFPSLRSTGFTYRPRLALDHPGLRQAVRLASWLVLFVILTQIGFAVVVRLASGVQGYAIYSYAYLLFQLPHAIIGVSIITALLPRMSRHAGSGRLVSVAWDLSEGLRLSAVILLPAALGLVALARPLCVLAFAHRATSVSDAVQIAHVLQVFGFALVPFSAYQLLLRAFYAMQDSRTPTLVTAVVVAVNVSLAEIAAHTLGRGHVLQGLAASFGVSYLVGVVLAVRVLRQRLGAVDGHRVVRLYVRVLIAAAVAALLAALVSRAVTSVAGGGPAGALAALVVATPVGAAAFAWGAARMRVRELRRVVSPVLRLLDRPASGA